MRAFRLLVVVGLFFFLGGVARSAIQIDLSGSNVEVVGADRIRVNYFSAAGYSGHWWAEFQWDPQNFIFFPVNAGQDTGNSWGLEYLDVGGNAGRITATVDGQNRTVKITLRTLSGDIYYCFLNITLRQGATDVALDVSPLRVGVGTALFTPETGWNGCGNVPAGQIREGTVSQIPSWFNVSSPFSLKFDSDHVYDLR